MSQPLCSQCPLAARKSRVFVASKIAKEPNGLLIAGEQPWRDEATQGEPFVGSSGRVLNACLSQAGIDRRECHIINAFSCFSGEISDGDKVRAAKACRPRLEAELAALAPSAVLALGGTALASILDNWSAKITDYLGAVVPLGSGAPMTASYHPAAVLRGDGCNLDVLAHHVHKVARWLREGGPRSLEDVYQLAPPPEYLWSSIQEWKKTYGFVTIDVETTGVNRFTCGLRTVGIGAPPSAIVIPFLPSERHYSDQEWSSVLRVLREALADPTLTKVFHHKQFDIPVLERFVGSVAEPTACTMVAHFVLYPKGVLHGLGQAAGMYLDVPPWKLEHGGDYATEPLEDLARYNARDVRYTAHLWQFLSAQIAQEQLTQAFRLQNDNARLALELSENGIPVDTDHWAWSLRSWTQKAEDLHARALELTGAGDVQMGLYDRMIGSGAERLQGVKLADFKAGAFDRTQVVIIQDAVTHAAGGCLDNDDRKALAQSADQLQEILDDWPAWRAPLDANGERKGPHAGKLCQRVRTASKRLVKAVSRIPFVKLTSDRAVGIIAHEWLGLPVMAPLNADGTYQTNETALWHVQDHPFVKSFQDWKEAEKQRLWLHELPVYSDGRIHPTYKTTRIPSSRFASGDSKSDDPLETLNAQNVEPRHLPMFRSPHGHGAVGADFSAAELRVAAVLSGCRTMIEQFERYDAGQDIKLHAQTARMFWPEVPAEQWTAGPLYDMAKRVNFLVIYGGGKNTLFERIRSTRKPEANPQLQAEADTDLKQQCEAALRLHKRTYPEIHDAAQRWYYDALQTGELLACHITGHRIRFPLHDKDHVNPNLCANLPVQTTAATIAHIAGHRLRRMLPAGAFLCTYTHDFYLVECLAQQMAHVAELMRTQMRYYLEGPAGGLWIYAEPVIGWSWKDVK